MPKKLLLLIVITIAHSSVFAERPTNLITPADLGQFLNPPPDTRIQYGEEALQFGELRIPKGAGPHPVAIIIHGGCWRAKFDLSYTGELAAALTREGIATWSIEYRRVGNKGGGWPGTFTDVSEGADHLRSIASEYQLDLNRVIVVGHSAGGHLALWLAARTGIPSGTPVSTVAPLSVNGVLALAPAPDISLLHEKKVCGHIIDKLMGGSPAQLPERYQLGDPMLLPPSGVAQVLVIGKYDDAWAPSGLRYFNAALARGEEVHKIAAEHSGHFEMIDPDSTSWPVVLEAVRGLFNHDED